MRGACIAQPPAVLPPPLPAHLSGWHSALFPSLALYSHAVSQVPTEADCVPAPLTTLLPRRCLRGAANSARSQTPNISIFCFSSKAPKTASRALGPFPPVPQALRRCVPGAQDARVRGPQCLGLGEWRGGGAVLGWLCLVHVGASRC